MIMTLAPATLFTLGTILLNVIILLCGGLNPTLFKQIAGPTVQAILLGFFNLLYDAFSNRTYNFNN